VIHRIPDTTYYMPHETNDVVKAQIKEQVRMKYEKSKKFIESREPTARHHIWCCCCPEKTNNPLSDMGLETVEQSSNEDHGDTWFACWVFVFQSMCAFCCCCCCCGKKRMNCCGVRHDKFETYRTVWRRDWHWLFRAYVAPGLCRVLSIFCWMLSFATVWSEISILFPAKLSVFGHIIEYFDGTRVIAEVVCVVPFFYISFCVYQSLLKMHIPFSDSLTHNVYPNHESDAAALMFVGTYVCRMQFSLGYNFLAMLQHEGSFRTLMPSAFKELYAKESDDNVWDFFLVVIPVMCVAVFFLNLFDVYHRIMEWFSLDMNEMMACEPRNKTNNPDWDYQVKNGRTLIKKKLRAKFWKELAKEKLNRRARDVKMEKKARKDAESSIAKEEEQAEKAKEDMRDKFQEADSAQGELDYKFNEVKENIGELRNQIKEAMFKL